MHFTVGLGGRTFLSARGDVVEQGLGGQECPPSKMRLLFSALFNSSMRKNPLLFKVTAIIGTVKVRQIEN